MGKATQIVVQAYDWVVELTLSSPTLELQVIFIDHSQAGSSYGMAETF